jgi:hypothetical protein
VCVRILKRGIVTTKAIHLIVLMQTMNAESHIATIILAPCKAHRHVESHFKQIMNRTKPI